VRPTLEWAAALPWLAVLVAAASCGGRAAGQAGAPDGGADAVSDGASPGPDAVAIVGQPVLVSAATRTPRTTTWSVNYWQWMPTYGDDIAGTETQIAALAPAVMRIGGYNNDANTPQPFDDAELDRAVAYARAIGADPLLQVPLLADTSGQAPTAATAAAMVTYANVTMGYAVKYFSVGNEPDLYPSQGNPSDSKQPAIPGYTPADYCTSARAYVAAMKAVDPSIRIVGPDLGYKYIAGDAANDWLTPILQGCGDLFDVVSIHRYPFEAKQATLPAAQADPARFRAVIASVQGILQTTGQGGKPLALMEMNAAYDATTCVLDASPGTVGAALWLADSLGAAIELGLWTSAVWDLSDDDLWALGLLGLPPAHTPRPAYYAYALYAEHFGPTLLAPPEAPAGVSAHASRNQADNATSVVVINWNASPAPLAFQVTGLAAPPAVATFVLPPTSIAAVAIPDTGPASAWTYGEAQRRVAAGPEPLALGAPYAGIADAGPTLGGGAGAAVGTGCSADGAVVCRTIGVSDPTITSMGAANGMGLAFGSGTDAWGSFTYAAPGQSKPTAGLAAGGDGLEIMGGFVGPVDPSQNYMGAGLYYNSDSCLDASAYTGVKFDFSGSLGGCSLLFDVAFSADLLQTSDPTRGGCTAGNTACYGPYADVTAPALAATAAAPTLKVPFSSLANGSPVASFDPTTLVSIEWQLAAPTGGSDASGCSAGFAVTNVSFY
jgi:hypothetical protein